MKARIYQTIGGKHALSHFVIEASSLEQAKTILPSLWARNPQMSTRERWSIRCGKREWVYLPARFRETRKSR